MEMRTLLYSLALSALAACQPIPLPESAPARSRGVPDQELFGATLRFLEAGRLKVTVLAPHLRRFEISDLMILEGGITAETFDANEQSRAILTADKGIVIEKDNLAEATGDVVVKSQDGTVLLCDTLYYDHQNQRIRSDGFVTLISPSDSITGYGFNAALDLTDWEIKRVSGESWRQMPSAKAPAQDDGEP